MTTRLLQLHMIYRNTETDDDDIIVERVPQVPQTSDPLFRVSFTSTSATGARVTYRTYFNRRAIGRYLQSIVDSLQVDEDPFKTVQVSGSIFPAFMYKVDELNWETRETMMDMMMMSINSDVTRVTRS
jgi:hypothetical protein